MAFTKGQVFLGVAGVTLFTGYAIRRSTSGEYYPSIWKMFAKNVIVTGGNSGIGREIAMNIAQRGGRIFLACRDLEKCEKTRLELIEDSSNTKIFCRKLDLASFESIHEFVENFKKEEKYLDVLVNNAAVMRTPPNLTTDGIEEQFQVNYLGHFLLTLLLLDKLKESGQSRVVNITSVSYKKGKIDLEQVNNLEKYNPKEAYDRSKLAVVMFTRELAKNLKGSKVTVNVAYPGVVKTDLIRHIVYDQSRLGRIIRNPIGELIARKPHMGAQTPVYLAVEPDLAEISGKYFYDLEEEDYSENALDDEKCQQLWLASLKWTGLL